MNTSVNKGITAETSYKHAWKLLNILTNILCQNDLSVIVAGLPEVRVGEINFWAKLFKASEAVKLIRFFTMILFAEKMCKSYLLLLSKTIRLFDAILC